MTLYADHFAEVDAKYKKKLKKALRKIRDMDVQSDAYRNVIAKMQKIAKKVLEAK